MIYTNCDGFLFSYVSPSWELYGTTLFCAQVLLPGGVYCGTCFWIFPQHVMTAKAASTVYDVLFIVDDLSIDLDDLQIYSDLVDVWSLGFVGWW